jgi:hypothetical protein
MNMMNLDDDELRNLSHNIKKSHDEPLVSNEEEYIKKTLDVVNQSKTNSYNNPSMSSIDDRPGLNFWPINDLPSKYKLYPEGTKILGRPLKVIEVKKLASLTDENAGYIINDILRRTIKGIDVNNILLADRFYIVLWLRSNTYRDSGYVVQYQCPKCEKETDFHFELKDLEVVYLSDDYNPNKDIRLKSGDVIKFKFLTIADEFNLDRFKETNSRMQYDEELLSISEMITSINGQKKTLMEKYLWLTEDLSPEDYSYIISYIEKYGMGVKPYINVTCKLCGGTSPVGMTFRPDFILPTYKID